MKNQGFGNWHTKQLYFFDKVNFLEYTEKKTNSTQFSKISNKVSKILFRTTLNGNMFIESNGIWYNRNRFTKIVVNKISKN